MNTSQTKRSSHGKKKYQVKKKPSTAETKSPARQPHHSPGELDFDADLYQQLLLAAKDPSYPNLKPLLAQCPPAYLNMSLRCPKQQTKTKNPKFSPSPLGLACEHGHIAFVQIAVETLKLVLLNSTTSTNLLSSIHAFSIASQFCHLDLVQYMLDHPNEVPLPTKNVTELHRILMQLLGRNSAAKTKIKMTIVPILERVLSHWTDDHISLAVNQVETKIGLSPFHLAVQTQEPTLLMLFMHRGGGNPQVRDQKGDSAFQLVQKSYLALDAKHHTTNGRGKKRRNRARAKTSVSGSSNTNHPDGGGGDPVACYMILLRHEEKEERSRIWCGFSRYRPEFITSEHMRGEILSSVGLSALFQPFALTKDAKDDDQDFKSVLAHVAMFHRSATKPGGGVLVEYWEKMKQLSTVQMHVAPRVIHRMLESCLEESCTPRYIRSLASIFMQWYVPTTKKQQESREEPKEQYFPSLDDRFYVRLCETLSGVGKKLLFGIFDRHDLDVNYDEDVEHDRYNALFELFLQLYVPSLFIMSNDQAERVTRYQMCTSSMEYLWEHVPHALGVLNGSIDNPSRFAVILQSKIISCQVEASFGCSSLVDMILQQQPTPKTSGNRRKHQKKTQNLLKRLSAELPIPSSFISWIRPLADKVDQLLLADIRLCRSFLHMCLRLPVGFISPRRKVEYLAALAEDRTSSNQQDDELCLQINRMSMTREEVLDFVLCQVSTLGPKMMQQELEIHYMYEPGVGLGPVREFFQFLRERVFQPTKSKNRECFDPKEENTKHSSMKMMEVVEHNHSNTFSMKDYYYHYHPKDVELKKKVQRLSLGAGDQVAGHAFAPYFQFTSESKEYLQIRSSRYRVYQMCRSVPGEAKPAMILSTIYSRQPDLLQCYRCIGRFIGLSIRHEQSLGIFFSIAFWKIMLRQEVRLKDHVWISKYEYMYGYLSMNICMNIS